MDPISALSVAAAVVQFVQFGSSLVSAAREIYRSEGALSQDIECDESTKRLVALTAKVKLSLHEVGKLGCLPADKQALEDICNGCLKVSEELQSTLAKLRIEKRAVGGLRRKWESFREALRSVWSIRDIERLKVRLAQFREQLEIHLMLSIREKVDSLTIGQQTAFTALNENIQQTIQALIDRLYLFREDPLEGSALALENLAEHDKTRTTILSAVYHRETDDAVSKLLRSLSFPEMRDRQYTISEAHAQTFKWIFDDQNERRGTWSSFFDWLQHGKGVYWINGKAGSGKSTLMRYIVNDPRTSKCLNIWSDDIKMDTGAFFFWNSGSLEQRSHLGLLRSLLHEILKRRPELVAFVFPNEWADGCSDQVLSNFGERMWSLTALKQAFLRLTSFTTVPLNLCFFIDGLDEYEGDHDSMVEFLKNIALSSHVKFCLSSRPWLVFEDAFHDSPGLRLQDLTHGDISAYVADELGEHPRMHKLSQEEPEHAKELINEIVSKANGVFLWVILVVKNLINGLRNRDDISDLRRRLLALPSELGALYTHMLSHLEPLYKQQASRAFQIYSAMWSMENAHGAPSALEFETAISTDVDACIAADYSPMGSSEIQNRCDRLEAHLKSRCVGLLELSEDLASDSNLSPSDSSSFERLLATNQKYGLKVNYLHRTVKDFLESEEVRSEMLQHTAQDPRFEPNTAVVASYIQRLKRSVCFVPGSSSMYHSEGLEVPEPHIWATIQQALKYARAGDGLRPRDQINVLDELDKVGVYWGRTSSQHSRHQYWSDYGKPIEEQGGFLATAVTQGLVVYADNKLKMDNSCLFSRGQTQPLLTHALLPNGQGERVCVEMVELLLRHGADPNQKWGSEWSQRSLTPWQRAVTWLHEFDWESYGRSTRDSTAALWPWVRLFKLLLLRGAWPDVTCTKTHMLSKDCGFICTASHNLNEIISDVFGKQLPIEAAELQRIAINMQKSSPRNTWGREHNNHMSGRKRKFDEPAGGSKQRWVHPRYK